VKTQVVQVILGPESNPYSVIKNARVLRASFILLFYLVQDMDTGIIYLVHRNQITAPAGT
jgi:hypothetical protein